MSRIYVPPSQDTLFMRGFAYHHRIEDIKDFFVREAGRCVVEFNKDDGSDGQYVALKFESRDIAKEVYRRFNDREILGDRISMTWYKDLRRVKRMNASRRYQRGGFYGSDQYEYRGSYQRSGYQRSQYRPTSSSRVRKYSRSSSRSRSASRSPTQSRSRSRSSSKSYDSRDFKKKRVESASSGQDQFARTAGKKKMKYSRNEGYESSESTNQKKSEKKKSDSLIVTEIPRSDNKVGDIIENNDSIANMNQHLTSNDVSETSPQHKAAAVRSLVQKKIDDDVRTSITSSENKQLAEMEEQSTSALNLEKEANETERNILELHPSEDEELEIEDNIDDASLVSLNFSNAAQEQVNGQPISYAEGNQNDKDRPMSATKVNVENVPAVESFRQAPDKSVVSFDLHVQQRKDAIAGLSYEKLKLMKEKKEDIEKAYRQDCETLVMVTKLLISKDPELEDRIQSSLRENLREIGHRCIQELKEFVEKIKTDDEF